ncbi:MAG: hypothetical protein OEN55_18735 [Alphaproteobacteria bacterium]|nr:hypothetical protein [Alphaproteobacteria bacterium]
MTDGEAAAAMGAPNAESTTDGSVDDRITDIRHQRDAALGLGDRETAEMLDALERELYDASEQGAAPARAAEGSGGEADIEDAAHAPLSRDEASGVFAFLDTVDPDATASLRREWGGDAAANLGYAHLWFTTQYTQAERDSMVVTPGLVRMAARMGRKLSADGREARSQRRDPSRSTDDVAGSRKHPGEIRHLRQEAQRNGDHRLARQYDEQERAAWARLQGAGPIVGRAGRKM